MPEAFDYRAARERVFALGLKPTLKLVMFSLIEHMPNCRPSVTRLAEMSGVERKTVMRSLARLEEMGHIEVDRGNGMRSLYQLRLNQSQPVPISPSSGTGTKLGPVPKAVPTSPINQSQPVPKAVPTSPKAWDPKQEADLKREAGVRGAAPTSPKNVPPASLHPGVARTYTMPCEEPPADYLDQAKLEFTPIEQAKATWHHYYGAGLPRDGVERLYPWLLQRAREKSARRPDYGPANRDSRGAPRIPGIKPGHRQPDCGLTGFEILGDKAPK